MRYWCSAVIRVAHEGGHYFLDFFPAVDLEKAHEHIKSSVEFYNDTKKWFDNGSELSYMAHAGVYEVSKRTHDEMNKVQNKMNIFDESW